MTKTIALVDILPRLEGYNELETELANVVQAVVEHGGAGKLTVTIEAKRGKRPGITNIRLADTKTKLPRPEHIATAFYNEEETHGGLTLADNRQPDLPYGSGTH